MLKFRRESPRIGGIKIVGTLVMNKSFLIFERLMERGFRGPLGKYAWFILITLVTDKFSTSVKPEWSVHEAKECTFADQSSEVLPLLRKCKFLGTCGFLWSCH